DQGEAGGFLSSVGAYDGVGSDERYFKISISFQEDIFYTGVDPLMIIEDLESLGEFVLNRVDKSRLPDFSEIDPEKSYLSWEIVLKTRHDEKKVRDVFLFVYEDNEIDIENVTEKYLETGEGISPEKRLGELLVDKGVLNKKDLDEVVKEQRKHNAKIGDIIVKKGFASKEDVTDALQEQEKIKKRVEVNTVRVDSSRLDNLMNLLGEIVIGQASLHRISNEMDEDKAVGIKNALYSLDRVTREFQEQIMSIRMVPIGATFDLFRRFVRDTAQGLGKEIKLKIEGGDTELDKTVIEKISDPLKHMIRNAIDHGIEPAEDRRKNSKPSYGTVTLKAYHQEGNVYIDIIDDGRGVNVEKVKNKALSLGLISSEDEIPREKLLAFLFNPGFTTSECVGELSGRGVGMDVVKTNIENLRGAIDIKTREGEGTLVRIKLPLTLAIIEGMLMRIGTSILIVPLLSVIETIQIKKEGYKTVEGKGELILVRGEYLSLVRLSELFGIEAEITNPWEALFVIVESGSERIGIMIDELIGQQQIVIKSIDNFITDSRAISGATILGDGRVALIVDIHGLAEEIKG
ncbi:MAG: chemotaxis protein CheA, partial [Spirochaetota bacterium]